MINLRNQMSRPPRKPSLRRRCGQANLKTKTQNVKPSKKNIIFFGSDSGSLPTLKKLYESDFVNVVAVVTALDKPVGRKQIITPTEVARFSNLHNIPTLKFPTPKKNPLLFLDEDDVYRKIKIYEPDLLIVLHFGQKIPEKVINLAKYQGLNIHFSLLPNYRGAAPVEWAIANGEKETGISVITLANKIDEGKILIQHKEPLSSADTAEILYKRLSGKCPDLLLQLLPDYFANKLPLIPQIKTLISYAPRLTKVDGQISWQDKPEVIERKIRAFYPWPGCWTTVKIQNSEFRIQNKRLKIIKAHLEEGKLVLDLVQLEGKKPVSFNQFQKAYPNFKFTN